MANFDMQLNNYSTKVGTLLCIVHCLVMNGKFQGYPVGNIHYTQKWRDSYNACNV